MYITHIFILKMWRLLFIIVKTWDFLSEIQAFHTKEMRNALLSLLCSISWDFLYWNKLVWKLLGLKQIFSEVDYLPCSNILSFLLVFLFFIAQWNYKKRCSDQQFIP
jgi:hypothetical protein